MAIQIKLSARKADPARQNGEDQSMDIYSHATPDMQEEVASALDQFLDP